MKKRHFITNGNASCGRQVTAGTWTAKAVTDVTCLACKTKPDFVKAQDEHRAAWKAAFEAQTPREFREPWREGIITCRNGHTLFRQGKRSCYGHYDEFYCAECGDNQSRLTETGMSF